MYSGREGEKEDRDKKRFQFLARTFACKFMSGRLLQVHLRARRVVLYRPGPEVQVRRGREGGRERVYIILPIYSSSFPFFMLSVPSASSLSSSSSTSHLHLFPLRGSSVSNQTSPPLTMISYIKALFKTFFHAVNQEQCVVLETKFKLRFFIFTILMR